MPVKAPKKKPAPSRKPAVRPAARRASKPAALTLAAFQDHIRAKYHAADAARGTPGTFMWLMEEVGELATALQKAAGEGGSTSGHADPAGEFADVLAWLCTLANLNGVDLDAAVRAKYFSKKHAPKGIK